MRDILLTILALFASSADSAEPPTLPTDPLRVAAETPEAARRRHERVAERRRQVHVICHRGAWEFAHENTLEAYRATFELGADGNEIDIRRTRDGVLICFHDDMLDRLLEAYGEVCEFTWEELRQFSFREPGPFPQHCRIPTLIEVFELHRRHAGLLHLDVKEPGLDRDIAGLLDRMDMWDHVAHCNEENAGFIHRHPRFKLCRYKAPGLFTDRADVDPAVIAEALRKPGDALIVDDPRATLVALGRRLGKVSPGPVTPGVPGPRKPARPAPDVARLIAELKADDGDRVAESPEERALSGKRIRARARAAELLLDAKAATPDVLAALEDRVRRRSLHKEWMYHGFDAALALRALILLRAPRAVEVARFTLWRDDPAVEAVTDPRWKNPRSWTDFRVKMVAFPALEELPGAATEKLCRDYLALTDEEARRIGPPQFEEAAKTLLVISPRTDTALELLRHRLRAVRGRAVLQCLASGREAWAATALQRGAPHALAYLPPKN